MIEINLLPEDLKKEKSSFVIPSQGLWYIAPAAIAILIVVHLYFAFFILIKNFQYKSLSKRWKAKRASQEKVQDWKKVSNLSSQDAQDIASLTRSRINFSDKLKVMSKALPGGIWFNRLAIEQRGFLLEGSVVSLEINHMSLLRGYLEKLKQDKNFFSDFKSLELGPVKMREFKGYQLMDFSLEGILK